jgi:hypothetical protein
MMVPEGTTLPELEGLKASAVAAALTVFPLWPQMREKKVGKPVCWIRTVTIGLTPNGAGVPARAEQSVLELDELPLPAEYVTFTVVATAPPTAF